jgi:aminopeptidase N
MFTIKHYLLDTIYNSATCYNEQSTKITYTALHASHISPYFTRSINAISMRLTKLLLVTFYLLPFTLSAQPTLQNGAPNPYYWKSRRPDAAYWQQDVHYTIDARIDEDDSRIDGTQSLVYTNNSPDTLTFVYFHLYQNAFIKGSYLHDLEKANKIKPRLGAKEAAGLGTIVESLKIDGADVKTELDNTILKVYLPGPLVPNKSIHIALKFKTWWDNGATRRRMKQYNAWGFKHFNGVQWFPKISVYDRKAGWDTYQHLNKEFYGDFGAWDVTLDFPSNYIVEATGALQNRKEALPDALRQQLDVKHFANKKWDEAPSIIIPYKKGERKKWTYHADNVHDFAFTADPSYRIQTTYWNGIECVGLVQEPHASGWQNSAEYVAKIIKTFSEDIGMYAYPKMVAADAADGMEYPMLTLDGGSDPGYHGLLVHEIGHNWFYGMVGSNETYRAAMDEGFTQWLTAHGLRRIDGETMIANPSKSKYRRRFAEPVNTLDRNVLNGYTAAALNQNELPLNTHSNDFHDALAHEGGYGQVYYKTASMLYNLQYVLGDSLFLHAMQHYFDQWKMAHPYFEDFRASIIQYTHQDLNWFFDQWLETTKTIDYGIVNIRRIKGQDSFAVKLRRKGSMQMPVDFTVTAKNGTQHSYHIPNTWFEKSTDAIILPKWFGWSRLRPTYSAHVSVPSGIRHVQIDTTYRLADINPLDNYKTKGLLLSPNAVTIKLDGGLANPTDRRHYRAYLRPDIWWNPIDGIKAGVHLESDYFNTLHRFDATVWYNTHVLQYDQYLSLRNEDYYERYPAINYSLSYHSPLTRRMPKLGVDLRSRFLDGLWYHRAGFNWQVGELDQVQFYGQTMWRPGAYSLDYLIHPLEWSGTNKRLNTSLNAAWTHSYKYFNGAGAYTLSVRAPFLNGNNANAFNYGYAQLEARNYNYIKKLEVRTRFFGRWGTGSSVPNESMLFAASANPEELMENKFTRTTGFVPDGARGYSRYETTNFQQSGGLNLRGYAGYFMADERDGEILAAYKARSGVGGNLEIDFDSYIRMAPAFTKKWLHVDAYLFADAGIMELSRYALPDFTVLTPTTIWGDVRADAGLGLAFTVKSWGVFEKAKPLTLRIDFPLFINRPPYANPQYATFRYVIGINRSF